MKRIAVCLLINLAFIGATFGQQGNKAATERVVMVPLEIALPVIVFQPDSQIQIEDIKVFQSVTGGGSESYKIRNIGTKPIRSYTIAAWTSLGTGSEFERPLEYYLLPGQVVTLNGNEVEVVELTDALRNRLNLRGEMQAVVFFLVVRVEFTDGSVYDGKPYYKSLKKHLDNLSLAQ